MSTRYGVWMLVSLLVSGCTAHPISPPRLVSAQTIAVLPPNNQTDDPLVVAGDILWDLFANRSRRVTVTDVLAAEARAQLKQRGFTVVPATVVEEAIGDHTPNSLEEAAALTTQRKIKGSALYIEITRWEPDTSLHPSRVLVSFEANLIDGTTGRILWTTHHPLRPVPTPGATTQGGAYQIAAHHVAAQLLRAWGTQQPTS